MHQKTNGKSHQHVSIFLEIHQDVKNPKPKITHFKKMINGNFVVPAQGGGE